MLQTTRFEISKVLRFESDLFWIERGLIFDQVVVIDLLAPDIEIEDIMDQVTPAHLLIQNQVSA